MYMFVCTGTPEHTSYSASKEQHDPTCPTCGAPTVEVRELDQHPLESDKITVIVKFDERSKNWSEDLEINRLFITTIFNYMSDILKARGHLFLNDVFDQLGLPRTSQGQLVGWLYAEKTTWWEMVTDSEEKYLTLKFYTHGVMYDKIEGES